jgi:hypothetical protein
MDEIIPDMAAQGVKPWVCLSYGNPAYEGGGGAGLHARMPQSAEALAAWDRYVAAFVERYGRYTDEWEIWNEPRIMEEYGELVLRTAAIVRARQPKARIIMAAGQAFDFPGTEKLLTLLQARGKLDLVDEIAGHPYLLNPDAAYLEDSPKSVIRLRRLIARFSSRIVYRQGETGMPSRVNSFGMFGKEKWLSEEIQAKWALRRLLGDLGNDVSTTSYFGICDMHYSRAATAEDMMKPGVINAKGLLATNPDQTVHHVKPAYHAVQHVTAIFDDNVQRIPDFQCRISGAAPESRLSVFGYLGKGRGRIITLWRSGEEPGKRTEWEYLTVTIPSAAFKNPVWVDLLSGRVCSLKGAMRKSGRDVVFTNVPVYDSVVLIAEAREIPTRTAPSTTRDVPVVRSVPAPGY